MAWSLDDPVHQRGQREHDEHLPDRVEPARTRSRDSGTKTAVRMIAAIPTGMLTQKIERQPTALTSTPPTTGPSARDRPMTPPQIPIALARSRALGEGVRDDRHRDRVEHRPAHGLHHAERDQRAEAGRQAAQQRADGEQAEPDLEGAAAPDPVGRRARQHEQAGDHQGVGRDDPLQAGDAGVQVVLDGRAGRRSRP